MAITLRLTRAARLASWLVVLVLICHRQVGATSIYEPGSLGVSFQDEPAEENGVAARTAPPKPQLPFLSQAAGNAMHESRSLQQQQRQQAGSRITGGQFLRPRTQATSKELLRRRHIAELLIAIADDLPKQKKQEPKRQQQQQQQTVHGTPAAEMPIYRNSRTFPSAGSAGPAATASYLRLPASGTDQLLAIGWPLDGSGPIVGGRGTAGGNLRESRKANFATTGIVWGATPDGQPVLQRVWPSAGVPLASPPYFSQHTANAAAASTKSARARARPLESPSSSSSGSSGGGGELAQLTANSLDGGPPTEPAAAHQQQHQQQRHHLRSGSEEVALHTPLNVRDSSSDYEWKRVENSRNSWNNLRGMWGKRSSPASSELGDNSAEQEQNQQQRQQQSGDQYRRDLAMLLDGLAASTGAR